MQSHKRLGHIKGTASYRFNSFPLSLCFKVKVLYARNLLLSTSEDTIEQVFSKFGEVERVKKIKDYSFIHFRTKEQARAALEAMNGNKTFMFMFCESITFQQVRGGFVEACQCIPRGRST